MDNLDLIKAILDQAEISDKKNAELQVALSQVQFYLMYRAGLGDLYAQNIVNQLCEVSRAS